jgi:methanogenic corrinoid protein MtbC1
LYSEYDIETIKWLAARQHEGLRINRAVALWNEIIDSGKDPFESYPMPGGGIRHTVVDIVVGETLKDMRDAWITACLAFDEASADSIISQAFARYPLETVCLDILVKGLSEIGDRWYSGGVTVQQEHFASALAIRRMDALLTAAPSPSRAGRFMVACPPGEEHIVAPLMITLFLRYRGWDVVYLGPNVPLSQLESTVRTTKPGLLIMTAMTISSAASLYQVANSLHAAGIQLAYGGRIFNQHTRLREIMPAYFLGESLGDAADRAEEIILHSPPLPEYSSIAEDYRRALTHFRDRQAAIESHIWEYLSSNGLKNYQLELANDYLNRDISAALTLGSLEYLTEEMDWIKMLLDNYNIPQELLPKYLNIYKQAVNQVLGEDGKPVKDWVNKAVNRVMEEVR